MLVLTRKPKESIKIFDEDNPDDVIEILIESTEVNRVRLVFDAPKHFRIIRGELEIKEKEKENSFKEGCYYVMNGSGKNWSDYDGPFDKEEAREFLGKMNSEYASPEMRQSVLTFFSNGMLDLVKE